MMEYLELGNGVIICGDTYDALCSMEDNYVDSIVTDPPYGISFMNKKWDYDVPEVKIWKEALRVLKPGGHMLVACGTRTQHRMVVNIEDAGFEIRDVITWHYGQGFPKSMDVSKSLDKNAGVERINAGISAPAKQWEGWGTALKPATEFWTLCRKPIEEKTVAANVLKYGTGGINIDGSRIETEDKIASTNNQNINGAYKSDNSERERDTVYEQNTLGRFPANVIFDEFTASVLDSQSGNLKSGKPQGERHTEGGYNKKYGSIPVTGFGDQGGASRFFYCAKASGSERNKGVDESFTKDIGHNRFDKCKNCGGIILQNPDRPSACKCEEPERENNVVKGNYHPTVKPVNLMRYLVRMITPKGGTCLDCYNGSGTTGIACKLEDFIYLGIESERDYCEISKARIEAW